MLIGLFFNSAKFYKGIGIRSLKADLITAANLAKEMHRINFIRRKMKEFSFFSPLITAGKRFWPGTIFAIFICDFQWL